MEVDTTQWLSSNCTIKSIDAIEKVLDDCEMDWEYQFLEADSDPKVLDELHTEDMDDGDILRDDALEFLSGYIIRKRHLEEYESSENTFTWVDQVSKGYLKKPSTHFVNKIKGLELVFADMNKQEISFHRNIQKRLVERSVTIDLPETVKYFFFKCRTHFRVKHLNKQLKIQKANQRLLGYKKIFKNVNL